MYDEYINAIQGIVDGATTLPVMIGVLPPSEGIATAPQGGTVRQFFKGARLSLPLSLNIKTISQQDGLEALGDVHAALRAAPLPQTAAWQMIGISVKSGPMYMGQSDDKHVFTSAIEARIYIRGDA